MSEGEERRKGVDEVSADGFWFWLCTGVATNNKTCKTALKTKYKTQFFVKIVCSIIYLHNLK